MRSILHARSAGGFVRTWLSVLLIVGMVLWSAAPTFAAGGQTGALQGTVVDAASKAPVAGARVVAAAPSARYTATTDKNGFFQFNGVTVDTYTVSITVGGYETSTVSGVTIQGDQTVTLGVPDPDQVAAADRPHLVAQPDARCSSPRSRPTRSPSAVPVRPRPWAKPSTPTRTSSPSRCPACS